MGKKYWEFDVPPGLQRAEEIAKKINASIPALEAIQALERVVPAWNSSMVESVLGMSRSIEHLMSKDTIVEQACGTAMLQAMEQAIPNYNIDGMASALKGFSAVLDKIPKIDHLMVDSILPQIKTSFDAWNKTTALDVLANADWSWISDVHADDDGIESDEQEFSGDLTDEIRAEMALDINEVIQAPEQVSSEWQKKYAKWEKRNPFWAELFMNVLSNLMTDLVKVLIVAMLTCVSSTISAIANKDAKVYEEPATSASVVYNITIEQNITIIGDAKYYYEIEVPDPVTGGTVIGYVYKGNVTVVETEAEEQEEEGETTAVIGDHASNPEFVLSE